MNNKTFTQLLFLGLTFTVPAKNLLAVKTGADEEKATKTKFKAKSATKQSKEPTNPEAEISPEEEITDLLKQFPSWTKWATFIPAGLFSCLFWHGAKFFNLAESHEYAPYVAAAVPIIAAMGCFIKKSMIDQEGMPVTAWNKAESLCVAAGLGALAGGASSFANCGFSPQRMMDQIKTNSVLHNMYLDAAIGACQANPPFTKGIIEKIQTQIQRLDEPKIKHFQAKVTFSAQDITDAKARLTQQPTSTQDQDQSLGMIAKWLNKADLDKACKQLKDGGEVYTDTTGSITLNNGVITMLTNLTKELDKDEVDLQTVKQILKNLLNAAALIFHVKYEGSMETVQQIVGEELMKLFFTHQSKLAIFQAGARYFAGDTMSSVIKEFSQPKQLVAKTFKGFAGCFTELLRNDDNSEE